MNRERRKVKQKHRWSFHSFYSSLTSSSSRGLLLLLLSNREEFRKNIKTHSTVAWQKFRPEAGWLAVVPLTTKRHNMHSKSASLSPKKFLLKLFLCFAKQTTNLSQFAAFFTRTHYLRHICVLLLVDSW